MYKQGKRDAASLALRKEAGKFLKSLRNAANLTQREVAVKLDFDYYTMIAQIEGGSARVPPHAYEGYAKALDVQPRFLAKRLMQYYDPVIYKLLFGIRPENSCADNHITENTLSLITGIK